MTGGSLFLNPEIRDHARSRGIELTPAEVDAISENVNSVATIRDGRVAFTTGQFLDLGEAIAAMAAGYGKPATAETPASSIPAGATATERAVATNRAAREGADALKRKQAEDLVKTFGSPWSVSGNMTHAAYIQNVHPELAARLRSEAGVRT